MARRFSVLCPIDFSAASLGALRYAATIAEHRHGQLTVMTVDDPILASMDATAGHVWVSDHSHKDLERVVSEVLGLRALPLDVQFHVAIGKPAEEILRTADRDRVDVVVMSSHGLTGIRKLFFGSTTERVLRDAHVPVLVSRPGDHGPNDVSEVRPVVNRVLVPVDLDVTAPYAVGIAAALAQELGAPLFIAHVVEPTRLPFPRRADARRLDSERRALADEALDRFAATTPAAAHAETLVVYGDPAEEIAKLARDRHVGLIVLPLRANAAGVARVGSVAYRVLCLAPAMVLALPGAAAARPSESIGHMGSGLLAWR
jgi:nucleotide-binding universal stress UspA family protein